MIQFNTHSKGTEYKISTLETDVVKSFLKSYDGLEIPYNEWAKFSHKFNVKSEIMEVDNGRV